MGGSIVKRDLKKKTTRGSRNSQSVFRSAKSSRDVSIPSWRKITKVSFPVAYTFKTRLENLVFSRRMWRASAHTVPCSQSQTTAHKKPNCLQLFSIVLHLRLLPFFFGTSGTHTPECWLMTEITIESSHATTFVFPMPFFWWWLCAVNTSNMFSPKKWHVRVKSE